MTGYFEVRFCFVHKEAQVYNLPLEIAKQAAENKRIGIYYPDLCPEHGKGQHGGGYIIVQSESAESAAKTGTNKFHRLLSADIDETLVRERPQDKAKILIQ